MTLRHRLDRLEATATAAAGRCPDCGAPAPRPHDPAEARHGGVRLADLSDEGLRRLHGELLAALPAAGCVGGCRRCGRGGTALPPDEVLRATDDEALVRLHFTRLARG
jgi:hypothetical protein